MEWDSFFSGLKKLDKNISATSDKKEEVYNILVEHNKKAELDFLKSLNNH